MSDDILPDIALDRLFRTARTYSHWQPREVSDALLQAVYELAKMGPTSANCAPMRIVFVKGVDAKARLKPHMDAGNIDKTMSAPVTALIAEDIQFYERLPQLFPHADARSWFAGNDVLIEKTAFRNTSLQGAYFMLAARALGLDVGPMSGFDAAGVNASFFESQPHLRVNFMCNLGYGDTTKLHPRLPRLAFDDVCQIL